MTLSERITADMKEAMKQKMNATLSTLRLLRSAIKNKEIDVQHELSDEEIEDVVKSQVKQLKDSVVSFEQGGRMDLVESVKTEINVLDAYLPAQMSDEVLESIVKEAVTLCGAQGKKDTGKAMGAAMKAVAGKADGTRVKIIVERLLNVFAFVVVGLSISAPAQAAIFSTNDFLFFDLNMGLRIIRVMLLWIGVFAVNSILSGGFSYMTSSNRDDGHDEAMGRITTGFVGSIVVVIMFAITTVYIDIL